MLSIIIADASLELVPKEVASLATIKSIARTRGKKPEEIVFDISHLLPLKKKILSDQEKRGRPDVVHRVLLAILDSPLKFYLPMKVYLHTYEGKIFEVDVATRLPRNYLRFIGLMEQLLSKGRVGPKDRPLIKEMDLDLAALMKNIPSKRKIALSEKGKLLDPLKLAKEILSEDNVVIVGGFPHGDFSKEVRRIIDEEFSLCKEVISASAAICMLFSYLFYALRWST